MIAALMTTLVLSGGSNLDGWTTRGDAQWSAADGVITAAGAGQGFLVSEAEFADFRLSLEFWIDATTNSGVFIRCRDRSRIDPHSCYELNIWDMHPRQEARTGAIVFRAMPPMDRVETVGLWNTMTVLARATRLEVRINGVLTAVLDDADPAGGFLALQHWESGVVKFRNIVLENLEE